MEFVLVRHAEPVTEIRSDDGPADPPLSSMGRRQAAAAAGWLTRERIDRIISSPSRRSRETALETARRVGLEVDRDPRLRDANPDRSRYVPLEVERSEDPEAYRARLAAYQDSGSLEQVSKRVNESLDEWAATHPGQRILVFCHGSVVNLFAARILGLEARAFIEVGYASASRFRVSRDGIRSLVSLNEPIALLPLVEPGM